MANFSYTIGAALDATVALAGTASKILRQVDTVVDAAGHGVNALGHSLKALDVLSTEMLNNVEGDALVRGAVAASKRADYGIRLEVDLLNSIREYKAISPDMAADYDRLYSKYAKLAGVAPVTLVEAAE